MSETKPRRGHSHWFINRLGGGLIRCDCGETFSGFVAWGDHARGVSVPVRERRDTETTQ